MTDRSYIGIDGTDKNEWVVVIWLNGKLVFSHPFKNTPAELGTLVRFITERCARPKICLRPTSPSALKLIKYIGDIPDVEVVLMSDAGLRMHRAWLPKAMVVPYVPSHSHQAYLLACCAERMV